MRHLFAFSMLAALILATPGQTGNTSSNSSSNSSNGVQARVDTVITDDGWRRVYERRVYRQRDRDDDRSKRRWQRLEDDDY